MARVHRLEHVQGGTVANLTHDDSVRPHTERVPHEVADRDLAASLDVRRSCLEAENMRLVELELRRVFDRDDPLVHRDVAGQDVERRGLSRAGAARDHDVASAPDAGVEQVAHLR